MTDDALLTECQQLLNGITPGPWAWEWVAEKSNEWAVGQAFDADGKAIEGELPQGEWLEDTIIERRLVGMNESGHANAADAKFIAAAPRLVRLLLARLQQVECSSCAELRARITQLEQEKANRKRFCLSCLGPADVRGKCLNDDCIGAEYSFDDPDGWPPLPEAGAADRAPRVSSPEPQEDR